MRRPWSGSRSAPAATRSSCGTWSTRSRTAPTTRAPCPPRCTRTSTPSWPDCPPTTSPCCAPRARAGRRSSPARWPRRSSSRSRRSPSGSRRWPHPAGSSSVPATRSASPTASTARCSTASCRRTCAPSCIAASARTSRPPPATPRRAAPPSWPGTSSRETTPSPRSASSSSPPTARSGATATPRGSRTCAPPSTPRPGWTGTSERTRWEVELYSQLGQALVAVEGWSSPEAETALQRARELAPRLGDNEPLISVLLALATLYEVRGELPTAQEMAEECLRLAPGAGSAHGLESTELLACNLFHQGSFARSLEHAERGVALFERGRQPGDYSTFPATLGDNAGVSCHDWAGLALWFLGFPDQALARAEHALEISNDPGRAHSRATARAQLSIVHACRREPERTLRWSQATIEVRCGARLRVPRRDGTGPARLGARAARRPRRGHRGADRRHRRRPRHGRPHGRPALPRAAGRRLRGRRRARRGAHAPPTRRCTWRRASARSSTRPSCTASAPPPSPPRAPRRRATTSCTAGWSSRASTQRSASRLRLTASLLERHPADGRTPGLRRGLTRCLARFDEGFETPDLAAAAALLSDRPVAAR